MLKLEDLDFVANFTLTVQYVEKNKIKSYLKYSWTKPSDKQIIDHYNKLMKENEPSEYTIRYHNLMISKGII